MKFLKSLLQSNYYGSGQAQRIFLPFVSAITDKAFLNKLNIDDSFNSRLACLAAFMFCWQEYLNHREQPKIQQKFIDLTVKLLDDSLRQEGVSDIRIAKKVKHKMKVFYAQLLAYDKLFGEHQDTPPKRTLQAVLCRYAECRDNGDAFANYLLDFRSHLNKINIDLLLQTSETGDRLALEKLLHLAES